MGISLSYSSVQKPAEIVIKAVKAEAAQINASRNWWSESFWFSDWQTHAGLLWGNTKFMPLAYFGQVDQDDNTFMACRDLLFIIAQLAKWSRAFEIDWKLDCCGQKGNIINAALDGGARSLVAVWQRSANIPPGFDSLLIEEKATRLLSKYASRSRTFVVSRVE